MLRLAAANSLRAASRAPLGVSQLRPLSSVPARVKLTLEQAISSGHLIISELKSPTMLQALEVGKQGDKLAKWQQANAVLIQSTLRVLPQVGLTSDPQGLQAYTEAFAEITRSEAPEQRAILQTVNTEKVCRGRFACPHPSALLSAGHCRSGACCCSTPSTASPRRR